jgi:hypothetical protein
MRPTGYRPTPFPWIYLLVALGALGGCLAQGLLSGPAGYWKNVEDPDQLIRFEEGRYEVSRQGSLRLSAPILSDTASGMVVCSAGRRRALNARREGGKLLISEAGSQAEAFLPVSGVPERFALDSFRFPEPRELSPERVTEVRQELEHRRSLDQKFRKPGSASPTGLDAQEARSIDTENLGYLKKLISEVGWIDARRFGVDASNTAFLLVQHSGELPLMVAALREIEKDVRAKLMDGEAYALLFDRVQLMQGNSQLYGSQVASDPDGQMVILLLKDPGRVDERRKEMGMVPLADYVRLFGEEGFKILTECL